MDNVYRPDEREEISEKIHLRKYFDDYKERILEGK